MCNDQLLSSEVNMAMTSTNLIDDFKGLVTAENPLHTSFMNQSIRAMREDTRTELTNYLGYCLSVGLTLGYLAECYNTIVNDTITEQMFFEENKRYRWSRFDEVAKSVYFDDAYMRRYMYGLAITAFLWPNHAALHDFFTRTFPRGQAGTYLEIGPGHGYYFMQSARLGNFDRMLGLDISASSVALTRDIVRHSGIDKTSHIEVVEADFLRFHEQNARYSCIVMGEVLEHVEEPELFLKTIASLSHRATHIFVTTCMNAPAVDHIALFRSGAEVEDIIASSGLEIRESCYVPYLGKTLAECEEQALPVNVGYVLQRAQMP
jgi:2-polyprenyl-3-methyl-5-hydroxy-6-metoxy-1,4-benzoquinol methylase